MDGMSSTSLDPVIGIDFGGLVLLDPVSGSAKDGIFLGVFPAGSSFPAVPRRFCLLLVVNLLSVPGVFGAFEIVDTALEGVDIMDDSLLVVAGAVVVRDRVVLAGVLGGGGILESVMFEDRLGVVVVQ